MEIPDPRLHQLMTAGLQSLPQAEAMLVPLICAHGSQCRDAGDPSTHRLALIPPPQEGSPPPSSPTAHEHQTPIHCTKHNKNTPFPQPESRCTPGNKQSQQRRGVCPHKTSPATELMPSPAFQPVRHQLWFRAVHPQGLQKPCQKGPGPQGNLDTEAQEG